VRGLLLSVAGFGTFEDRVNHVVYGRPFHPKAGPRSSQTPGTRFIARLACSARRHRLAERIFCVRLEELVCALVRDTQDGADVSNAEACGAKLPCSGAPVLRCGAL